EIMGYEGGAVALPLPVKRIDEQLPERIRVTVEATVDEVRDGDPPPAVQWPSGDRVAVKALHLLLPKGAVVFGRRHALRSSRVRLQLVAGIGHLAKDGRDGILNTRRQELPPGRGILLGLEEVADEHHLSED